MIGKILRDLEKTGLDSLVKYDIELMSKLYFNGKEEELADFLFNNKESLQTEKDINIFFESNFPLILFFKLLSKELKEIDYLTDCISIQSSLQSNEKLKELVVKIPEEHWGVMDEFFYQNMEEIKEVAFDKLGLLGLEKEVIKKKLFSTTKRNIAVEFGVDIKTLNKWLVILFQDKFNGERKIYYKEYVEIFKALFLAEGEDLDLAEHMSTYKTRLDKGLNFRKKDIAEYINEGSDLDISGLLKIQKEQLRDNESYNFTNVFPYSIMKVLVEELGDEIDF